MTQQRGTRTEVITSEYHGPGTEGISRTARQVVIVGAGGRDPVTEQTPAVHLVTRSGAVAGVTLQHFEPVEPVGEGRIGYMASGAYVVVPVDVARALDLFPAAYALHDRSETPADYRDND
ncbi:MULTISPECIES: hypothetical protein [unclassified Rathayibacter]|uniref:hypothetical protein n=1 Tax=unclassified Rathayibacter TaxID=2609250 RepID=UPI000CE8F117|nr:MULTISPECIES: hypothetical protein [unclassified Rathayibacter]PPF25850.1 hypothetical protein C5C54_14470 [Rathayibacter sp. AY1F2]PPH43361.1 hypothetical protein C5C42_13495 [Rathayibacter sp. AY1F7]PPH50899.1 hypothetical protein C5C49_13125 [Rathayibacter sp. AY1E2]